MDEGTKREGRSEMMWKRMQIEMREGGSEGRRLIRGRDDRRKRWRLRLLEGGKWSGGGGEEEGKQ